jgi:hypothetical protein
LLSGCWRSSRCLRSRQQTPTLYGDLSKQGLLEFNYAVRNFKERSYDQIPYTGLSADNVYRETKRALEGGRNAYVDLVDHRYRRLCRAPLGYGRKELSD